MCGGARQRVFQQHGDHRVGLAERHLEARGGEQQGVLAEARRRVDRARVLHALHARRLDEHLALQRPLLDAREHLGEIGLEFHAVAQEGEAIARDLEIEPAGRGREPIGQLIARSSRQHSPQTPRQHLGTRDRCRIRTEDLHGGAALSAGPRHALSPPLTASVTRRRALRGLSDEATAGISISMPSRIFAIQK